MSKQAGLGSGHAGNIQLSDIDMLHVFANDFRLPLTQLANSARMLTLADSDRASRALQHQALEHGSRRMMWQVDGMLLASLVQKNRLQLNLQSTSVPAVAHAVSLELRPYAKLYAKEVSLSVSSAIKPAAADREALAHSIHSLLDLSIRTSQSDSISIFVHHQVNAVRLSIRDQGPSLTDMRLDPVIPRTGVALQTHKHVPGTSGTPLVIASTLARAMGGTICYRQTAGQRVIGLNIPISSQLELM